MKENKRIAVITGHYGSGKTNIAVNMALQFKEEGKDVIIIDMDIVNPYFRTADSKDMLEKKGIEVITPMFANTNLDVPSLPASINRAFSQREKYVIIDVGGDDAGAIALGQYSDKIKAEEYDMYYVINERRLLTTSPEETVEILGDIERASNLKATKLINNTNLGKETTEAIILNSEYYAKKVSELSGLPIEFTVVERNVECSAENKFLIDLYTKSVF